MATPKDALLLLPGILPPGWVLIPGCAKEDEEEEEAKTPLKKEDSSDPASCNGETTTAAVKKVGLDKKIRLGTYPVVGEDEEVKTSLQHQ